MTVDNLLAIVKDLLLESLTPIHNICKNGIVPTKIGTVT